ncbi:MAG: cell division protein SepF [Candidatus Thalassarchaeaceae archaeon]|nr:cell division protein SepF [Candidatus Thalassarchaeaceae archaeon]
MAKEERDEPRWIEMPSLPNVRGAKSIDVGQDYHDLGELYVDAPVVRGEGDVIVRRAVLDDLTGIPQILDWISDGDIVILEMSRLIAAETELRIAVDRMQTFIENDLMGELFRIGQNRLLLLPASFDISVAEKSRF